MIMFSVLKQSKQGFKLSVAITISYYHQEYFLIGLIGVDTFFQI